VNTNGTLSVFSKEGMACFWLGQTPSNDLPRYVDARLRARGVLLLGGFDTPVLLVPSRAFLDVRREAPEDPFANPRCPIAGLTPESIKTSWPHRVRVAGEVTYCRADWFCLQDASGGLRVRLADSTGVAVGQTVEVVGFPSESGSTRLLNEPLTRPAPGLPRAQCRQLNLAEPLTPDRLDTLVRVSATLLARGTNEIGQVLQLQEQQHIFAVTLAAGLGELPALAPGSLLQITGVCDATSVAPASQSQSPSATPSLRAANLLLLRGPGDVRVLSGPPWWNWRRTAGLVGALAGVLLVALLWVYLLRRRLERQQAAQLAFSRQVFERVEAERRRIAINLHDSLGQVLTAIRNQALMILQGTSVGPDWRKRLEDISGVSSKAIDEVRQITRGLRPYELDRFGLAQGIRASLKQTAARCPTKFAVLVEDIDGLFGAEAELHIYRIVQESVTNVVKHAAATEATVVIKKTAGAIAISVRDNGRGFDPAQVSSQHHDIGNGLSGIQERVRVLGGRLSLDSRPGTGTNLSVDLPLSFR
jgi:signal transduction histidine kinase